MLYNHKEKPIFAIEGQILLLLVDCASIIMTYIDILDHLLFIMNVILHSIGLYLISKASKEFKRRNAQIVNISVAIVLLGLVHEIRGFLPAGNEFGPYLLELKLTLKIPYHFSMIILSIDRFCAVYMHLRYPGSWIARSAFKMTPIPWSFQLFIMIPVFAFGEKMQNPLRTITTITNILTVGVFFIVYPYLFLRFRRMLKKELYPADQVKKERQKIFAPFIVILTFVILQTIPVTIAFSTTLIKIVHPLLMVDGLVNGVIYIFLQHEIRLRLFMFCRYGCCENARLRRFKSSKVSTITPSTSACKKEEVYL